MTESAAMDSGVMRILIAIDGSEPAALGLDLVAGVSWPADTEVVVAQAVETGTGLFGGAWPSVTMVQPDELEIAVERPGATRTSIGPPSDSPPPGLHVRPIVLRGAARDRRRGPGPQPAGRPGRRRAAAATARSSR